MIYHIIRHTRKSNLVPLCNIDDWKSVKGKTLWNHTIELSNCHECTKRYKIINLKDIGRRGK